ncbi:MAG: hypothetical protein QNJ42_11385 [Crocosphaera sp.]|nr:hypothetical protein [Crocosphaera sp.]
MINLEQLKHDINELPEEAQELLIDFVELLKKRYASSNQQETPENKINDLNCSCLTHLTIRWHRVLILSNPYKY